MWSTPGFSKHKLAFCQWVSNRMRFDNVWNHITKAALQQQLVKSNSIDSKLGHAVTEVMANCPQESHLMQTVSAVLDGLILLHSARALSILTPRWNNMMNHGAKLVLFYIRCQGRRVRSTVSSYGTKQAVPGAGAGFRCKTIVRSREIALAAFRCWWHVAHKRRPSWKRYFSTKNCHPRFLRRARMKLIRAQRGSNSEEVRKEACFKGNQIALLLMTAETGIRKSSISQTNFPKMDAAHRCAFLVRNAAGS